MYATDRLECAPDRLLAKPAHSLVELIALTALFGIILST